MGADWNALQGLFPVWRRVPTALLWAGEGSAPSVRKNAVCTAAKEVRRHTGRPSPHTRSTPSSCGAACRPGLRILGDGIPLRCRGLARKMHLRCAPNGTATWAAGPAQRCTRWPGPARGRRTCRHGTGMPPTPTTDLDRRPGTPRRGTLLAAHGNAVGHPPTGN
jgi:hypothetical protein